MKPVVAVLGIGMIILGLWATSAVAWLGWLDVLLGVVALVGIPAVSQGRKPELVGAAPAAIGVAAVLLWIVALAVGASTAFAWWTFAFGVAFLLTAGSLLRPGAPRPPSDVS